ncbi:hypothetical protein [Xanthomonas axonopodis]|nr:hypothetical protein [Xanthomonas axonopodis]
MAWRLTGDHRFDVVVVGVDDERGVIIVAIVRPQAWRAMAAAAVL